MARTINCDSPGCQSVASWLVTNVDTGAAQGLCNQHWIALAVLTVQRLSGDDADPELAQQLAGIDPNASAPEGANADDEGYYCELCNIPFASLPTIEQHIRDVHPDLIDADDMIDPPPASFSELETSSEDTASTVLSDAAP